MGQEPAKGRVQMPSSLRRVRELFCIALLLVSVLAGSVAMAQIEWRSGEVVALQPMPRAQLEAKMRGLAGREDKQRVVLNWRARSTPTAGPGSRPTAYTC